MEGNKAALVVWIKSWHFNQTPHRQHEWGCVFISFYVSRCYWITLFCRYEIYFKMHREIIGSKVTKKKKPPESRELKRKHLARQRAGNQVKLQQVWNVTDLRLHTWTRVHTCITTSSRQLHTGRPIPGFDVIGQLVGGLLGPEYFMAPSVWRHSYMLRPPTQRTLNVQTRII